MEFDIYTKILDLYNISSLQITTKLNVSNVHEKIYILYI